MRLATSGLRRGAVCAVALMSWVYGAHGAAAKDEAAHALAEKFSQAADDGQSADETRKAEARAKAQAEAKKQADAAKRKAAADKRSDDEAEMLRSAKEEAEARRAADQARTEAELRRETEQARIEGERQAARAQAGQMAEDARKQHLEQERLAEERRSAEAARLTREVEEQRHAEEQRLAADKAEADRKAEVARRDEERRVAAELAEAERKANEARLAEQKRKAEETRLAEIKRQAEEAETRRRAEEARVAELKQQAEAAEAKRKAEEERFAEQRRIADAKAAEQRAALEAQREVEAQRIAEKFRIAREARERSKETRNSLGGPLPEEAQPSPFIGTPAAAKATYPQRVTVLVVMQPRPHGFAKMTANPVLCVGDDCYVSNGAGAQASLMRRAQALGPGNTIGRNAGVCRNHTVCAFRGVTLLAPPSTIQPVDLGFWHHDRREIRTVEPDRSCDVGPGQLFCSEPIVAAGYRAWIVPEAVADKAGARALERALDQGLPASRSASNGNWQSTVQALPTR